MLVSASSRSRNEQEERLLELTELASSAGVTVIDRMAQRTPDGHQRYLLGSGKLKDVLIQTLHKGADMVIFDQTLTPAQSRAISEMTDIKVIDRTQLILDIFARRAHSREGKVQVELAQLRYLLPRLSGKGTELSRLGGGIGSRGPGETKLETDRRRIRDRITHLERELQNFARQQDQRRARRTRHRMPVLSLVGYTNAGKSTLLNVLTKSHVSTQDRVFETLDTTSRRLRFPRDREVIAADTVGFIRDLPQELVGAFRTTLEELREADLLDLDRRRDRRKRRQVESQAGGGAARHAIQLLAERHAVEQLQPIEPGALAHHPARERRHWRQGQTGAGLLL